MLGPCETLMNEIADNSVDLILCDLPYQITDCRWDSKIDFIILWQQYNRIRKKNTAIVLFGNQPFTTDLIASNKKLFRYCWYWIKNSDTGFAFAKGQSMRCVEDVAVFYEKAPTYNPIGLRAAAIKKHRKTIDGSVYKSKTLAKEYIQKLTGYPNNLLFFNAEPNGPSRFHATQKPVNILEYLIRTYTNYGDTILDNTMGSGSTGVAAINTGRRFIGIEKNRDFFEYAVKRIKEAERLNKNNLFDIETIEGNIVKSPPITKYNLGNFINE
jgi:site-specific DNA-methyltransferase (adenine-specific)